MHQDGLVFVSLNSQIRIPGIDIFRLFDSLRITGNQKFTYGNIPITVNGKKFWILKTTTPGNNFEYDSLVVPSIDCVDINTVTQGKLNFFDSRIWLDPYSEYCQLWIIYHPWREDHPIPIYKSLVNAMEEIRNHTSKQLGL